MNKIVTTPYFHSVGLLLITFYVLSARDSPATYWGSSVPRKFSRNPTEGAGLSYFFSKLRPTFKMNRFLMFARTPLPSPRPPTTLHSDTCWSRVSYVASYYSRCLVGQSRLTTPEYLLPRGAIIMTWKRGIVANTWDWPKVVNWPSWERGGRRRTSRLSWI